MCSWGWRKKHKPTKLGEGGGQNRIDPKTARASGGH